jgi:hypothetical protein
MEAWLLPCKVLSATAHTLREARSRRTSELWTEGPPVDMVDDADLGRFTVGYGVGYGEAVPRLAADGEEPD